MNMHPSKGKIFFVFFIAFLIVLGLPNWSPIQNYQNKQELASELSRLAERTVKSVNLAQLTCLATNIYHEASGEPFMGQVAVARVVINRIRQGFASTPCAVVYQTALVQTEDAQEKKVCQFSWVCEGKSAPSKSSTAYKTAESIAYKVLAEDAWRDSIPATTVFFHSITVQPKWAYPEALTIGNHVFYNRK